jgi:VWFA-related protein
MRHRVAFALVSTFTDRARVDAIVTDSQGSHVPGLTQKDFILHQDRATKAVTTVEWLNEAPASIVFVIDDLSMRLGDCLAVQDALRRFVEEQMRPGQQVSIIRVSGGSGILQRLTDDPAVLRKAIDRMTWELTHNPYETLAWFLYDSTLHLQRIQGYKTMIVLTTREHRYPLFEIWNTTGLPVITGTRVQRI